MQLVVQKISVARRPKCQNCKKCSTCWSWDYTAIKSEDSSASDLLNLIFYLFLVWPWHWVRVLQNRDEAMDGCQEINQSIKKSIHSSITQSSINSSINYRVLIKYYPFSKNFQYLRPLPRKDRAAIGFTENDQPIRVTVHSVLRSEELISYRRRMGCNKFGTQFSMNTLYFFNQLNHQNI